MSSNYNNNPSMEEILERIKKALADRERRIEQESSKSTPSPVIKAEEEIAEMAMTETKSSITEEKTATQSPNNDEIFIKPNLANTKQNDVFILSKNMKVNSAEKFAEIDFSKLFHEISTTMTKDLAIAYMAPKIESWLNLNFAQISTHCRKK